MRIVSYTDALNSLNSLNSLKSVLDTVEGDADLTVTACRHHYQ